MNIEILGPGCTKCQVTEKKVHLALEELKISAAVSHVYDPKEFARRGVLFTPAVIVDGVVKGSGRVPTLEEIKGWLSGK